MSHLLSVVKNCERHRKVQITVTSGILITCLAPSYFGEVVFIVNLLTNVIWIWAE